MSERLISADSHINVTQDQVKAHLARRYHTAYDDAVAQFENRVLSKGTAKVNREGMREYKHPAFGRAGQFDPIERLKDMDTDGVDAEILYCEVSAFRYLYLMKDGFKEAARAFNGALHAFGAADTKRLIVSYQVPINDVDLAVSEVRRVAALGAKSLQLPVFPNELGCPEYCDARYDPLWQTVQELDLPMCFHIGINTSLDELAARDPTFSGLVWKPVLPLYTSQAIGFWITTGVLDRFPDLKLVFVESGIGWIPWYLDLLDDIVTRQRREAPEIKEIPSYYFHRNISLTFIDEPNTIDLLRHRVGVHKILWSSDYPHPISSWPNSRAVVNEVFKSVTDEERALMTGGNSARLWNL
jgi:predicted TIM-barrel fold metal-dependent hydrolase